MKSIVKRVLNNDWSSIQEDLDKMASDKVKKLVANRKIEILADLNGITPDEQTEMMNVSSR